MYVFSKSIFPSNDLNLFFPSSEKYIVLKMLFWKNNKQIVNLFCMHSVYNVHKIIHVIDGNSPPHTHISNTLFWIKKRKRKIWFYIVFITVIYSFFFLFLYLVVKKLSELFEGSKILITEQCFLNIYSLKVNQVTEI